MQMIEAVADASMHTRRRQAVRTSRTLVLQISHLTLWTVGLDEPLPQVEGFCKPELRRFLEHLRQA